jgi:hypothetical protein
MPNESIEQGVIGVGHGDTKPVGAKAIGNPATRLERDVSLVRDATGEDKDIECHRFLYL